MTPVVPSTSGMLAVDGTQLCWIVGTSNNASSFAIKMTWGGNAKLAHVRNGKFGEAEEAFLCLYTPTIED